MSMIGEQDKRFKKICAAWVVAVAAAALPALGQEFVSPAGSTSPAGTSLSFEAPPGAIVVNDGWFVEPNVHRPPLPTPIMRAFVVPIREVVTEKTGDAIKRKVIRCRESGAQMIIFDIDTPGGSMTAMLGVFNGIAEQTRDIYTVAYVNRQARSAGAIVSLACDEIDVTPGATIGDCSPVQIGMGGYVSIADWDRRKIESYIKAQIRSEIEIKGHNLALCEGMVSRDMEIWLVRSRKTGELQIVKGAEWRGRLTNAPPSAQPVATGTSESPDWEFVRVIDGPESVVTLTASEAVNLTLARHTFGSIADLAKYHHIANPPQLAKDPWDDVLAAAAAATEDPAPGSPASNPAVQTQSATTASRPEPTSSRSPSTRVSPVAASASTQAATSPTATSRPFNAPPGAIVVKEGWFAEPNVQRPPLPEEITRAFVIPIREVITEKTGDALKRKVIRCRQSGAQMIILDIDTPGGAGGAMLDIFHLIADQMKDIHTVAYVNPQAISAGAIISLACDEIDMTPNGVIGDSMPVQIGEGGYVPIPKEERGKIESYIKAQIRSEIQRKGYNQALCEGMVTLSLEIWLIRDRKTGELQVVNAAEWRGRLTNAPPSTQPATPGAVEAPDWEFVRVIDGPESIVTLTAPEAMDLAFASHIFDSLTDLEKFHHIMNPPQVLEDTWSEKLVEMLTSPTLTSILVFVGIICIYMEVQHPGLIAPAAAGILCFAVVFGSRYLIGMSDWWEIALFIVGLLLVVVELFLPTFGVLGILGAVMCLVALLALAVPVGPGKIPIPKTDLDWTLFGNMVFAMGLGFVGALVAISFIARHLPQVPLAKRLMLAPVVVPPDTSLTEDSPIRRLKSGDEGVVETQCHPVGKVRFGDDLLDATSEGAIIESGQKVRVLRREGNQVIVEKV